MKSELESELKKKKKKLFLINTCLTVGTNQKNKKNRIHDDLW